MSPVPTENLASYLGDVDSSDPLLQGFLDAATEAVMAYTNVELVEREWTWQADRYPERQGAMIGIGGIPALAKWWITLPAWPLVSIEDVTADSFHFETHTSRLFVRGAKYPLTVKYTAGYVDPPSVFKQAILMLAAYMYEHRGACSSESAGKESGAFALIASRRRYTGGL